MSRDVLSIEFATDLDDAWDLMQTHDIRALPVVDRGRYVKGIVTRTDFITHARVREGSSLRHRLRALLLRTTTSHSDKPEAVGQIMTTPVKTASEDMPIVELVPWMSDEGLRHIPIVDAERRLVGMLTQSDLVAALYQNALSHLVAPQPSAAV
jgi:CBS domain-containing membrane protein